MHFGVRIFGYRQIQHGRILHPVPVQMLSMPTIGILFGQFPWPLSLCCCVTHWSGKFNSSFSFYIHVVIKIHVDTPFFYYYYKVYNNKLNELRRQLLLFFIIIIKFILLLYSLFYYYYKVYNN